MPSYLVLACCSMKPHQGSDERSAVRSLCQLIETTFSKFEDKIKFLDLRDIPLPFFDGRLPDDMNDPNVNTWIEILSNADAILFGVPAYWAAPSGTFVNAINVLGGPIYKKDDSDTIFNNKDVGYFMVADDASNVLPAQSMITGMLQKTGAKLPFDAVILSNPREESIDWNEVNSQLVLLTSQLLKGMLSNDH